MKASCHCGQVTVKVPVRPEYVNFCDCTLCAKTGGAWSYYPPEELKVAGTTTTYRREDYDNPVVVVHFCPHCGTTTHWRLIDGDERNVCGLNMRLFSPAELEGIEARFQDGRNWDCKGPAELRRPHGTIGKDALI